MKLQSKVPSSRAVERVSAGRRYSSCCRGVRGRRRRHLRGGLEGDCGPGDAGDRLSLHPLDITDREQVLALPASVADQHGKVDGLVNIAGIIQPFVDIIDLDFDVIERVINVNFWGTVNMVKAFLPIP